MRAHDPATRDRMIVETMATGMTRQEASVLVDVGKHAFDEAMATAMRVVDTCPPDLRMPAFASVLASFATVMRERLPEHWAAFVAVEPKEDTNVIYMAAPGGDA